MGVLGFGAQRLMPTLQQAYQMYAGILGNNDATREVLAVLGQQISAAALTTTPPPLPLLDEIHLQQLSFRYGNSSPLVLDRVDLRSACQANLPIEEVMLRPTLLLHQIPGTRHWL